MRRAGLVRQCRAEQPLTRTRTLTLTPTLTLTLTRFANAAPTNPVRSPFITEAYQREACELIFGKGVWPDTASVNRHYGGRAPAVTNVFFSHGVEDPWQHASMVKV